VERGWVAETSRSKVANQKAFGLNDGGLKIWARLRLVCDTAALRQIRS
jgi:hypothetical protein